jgi:glycosyltransferase involved in cell wall biosynthesis
MPSLNQAQYIEEAIRSVLDQPVEDLLLVVADGGSTDGTLAVLERLALEAKGRLAWHSEQDSGAAQAVNKALARCRGGILGWLNSDDAYAPGAAARALEFFQNNPRHRLVYGRGEHIDERGRSLGEYPTRPPATPLAEFAQGCFICQPTAFFRREMAEEIGGLDETLKTAFDFDWWLRAFKRYGQAQIGYLDAVQAYSRLHGACMTRRLRRQVALEGMAVLSRHLGEAPGEWLLTYVEELLADYPFVEGAFDLRAHLADLCQEARPYLSLAEQQRVADRLAFDSRLRLATREAMAAVYPDGWAGPALSVRVRAIDRPLSRVVLRCRHAWPVFRPLRIKISAPWGGTLQGAVDRPGPFDLTVPLPGIAPLAQWCITIQADAAFVPRDQEPGSDDARALAYRVEGLEVA